MGVGQPGSYLLRLFGAHVDAAFGHTPYLVGSALTKKSGWRDVDVRLILPNDEHFAYFGDWKTMAGKVSRAPMWNLVWSEFGKSLTGLPIDFQIQSERIANEDFGNLPRSALMLYSTDLPFTRGW